MAQAAKGTKSTNANLAESATTLVSNCHDWHSVQIAAPDGSDFLQTWQRPPAPGTGSESFAGSGSGRTDAPMGGDTDTPGCGQRVASDREAGSRRWGSCQTCYQDGSASLRSAR